MTVELYSFGEPLRAQQVDRVSPPQIFFNSYHSGLFLFFCQIKCFFLYSRHLAAAHTKSFDLLENRSMKILFVCLLFFTAAAAEGEWLYAAAVMLAPFVKV